MTEDEVVSSESVSADEQSVSADSSVTADELRAQIKPLSSNGFVRFFQNLYRKWLGVWYGFCDKHPKLSDLIYKVVFFFVFSMGVTIWQYIVMAVVPLALPKTAAVGWPMIPLAAAGGRSFIIFGDEQGWAMFICFEIAVFTAQCINFPLQRNITYRSHGNPYFQAMWYFIGWVLVSVATNALWGVANAFLLHWNVPELVIGLAKTVLTGGVSMVVFFFIFMIIFPDNNAVAKRAKKKYDNLVAKNADPEKIEKAKVAYETAQIKADKSNADKEYAKAKSQASGKAMRYFASVDRIQKAKTDEEKATLTEKSEKAFSEAVEAVKVKNEKEEVYNRVFGLA
ncbi:MAG: hypothetical protein J1F33_03130 [Clostridiales bacterium]|nr:hypothetical protein [Clostridiales bacterium]